MAFEANDQFYQFTQLLFGVISGVPTFQQSMEKKVKEENLKDTFPYLNNIIIGGEMERGHHKNIKEFLKVVKKRNLTQNG